MAIPYNYKAIEKKWRTEVEERLANADSKEDDGSVLGKKNEICRIHESRMRKKMEFSRDLYFDYGYDAVRMYEIFSEPTQNDAMWDDGGIDGIYRFLTRFWRLVMKNKELKREESGEICQLRQSLLVQVEKRMKKQRPDTVIAALMESTKKLQSFPAVDLETLKVMILLMAPFAWYMAEELWQQIGMVGSVFEQLWPAAKDGILEEFMLDIPVQVNGRVCGHVRVPGNISETDALKEGRRIALERKAGKIEKEIYIKGRIISFYIS